MYTAHPSSGAKNKLKKSVRYTRKNTVVVHSAQLSWFDKFNRRNFSFSCIEHFCDNLCYWWMNFYSALYDCYAQHIFDHTASPFWFSKFCIEDFCYNLWMQLACYFWMDFAQILLGTILSRSYYTAVLVQQILQ